VTVAAGAGLMAALFLLHYNALLPDDALISLTIVGSPLPALVAMVLGANGVACAALIARSTHRDYGVLVMHYGLRCAAAGACAAGAGLLVYVLWLGALFPLWNVDVWLAEYAIEAVLLGGGVFVSALPAVASALFVPWIERRTE
jgi:hypothetical protein